MLAEQGLAAAKHFIHLPSIRLACSLILFALGTVFATAGFALYEYEEKKLGDRLERWWVQTHDASLRATSKASVFAGIAARASSTVLDRMFGEKLFSLRGISVFFISSLCFAFASFVLFTRLLQNFLPAARTPIGEQFSPIIGIAWLLLGITPVFIRRRAILVCWALFVIWKLLFPVVLVAWIIGHTWGAASAARLALGTIIFLLASSGPELTLIAVNRYCLRRIGARPAAVFPMVVIVIGNILLALCILIGPIWLFVAMHSRASSSMTLPITVPLLVSALFNGLDLICSLLIFLLGGFLLAYRYMFWPLICRPLYRVAVMTKNEQRAFWWAIAVFIWGGATALVRSH